jgi:hypothetical protein
VRVASRAGEHPPASTPIPRSIGSSEAAVAGRECSVYAVVNRLRLSIPVPGEVFEAAQRDIPPRAALIEGLRAFHVLRVGEEELVSSSCW